MYDGLIIAILVKILDIIIFIMLKFDLQNDDSISDIPVGVNFKVIFSETHHIFPRPKVKCERR